MSDQSEQLVAEQRETNRLLSLLIKTMQDQVKAIDELCVSNDQMMVALAQGEDEPNDGAAVYLDGTPKG